MDKLLQSLVETINHINRPKNAIIRIYIEYKNNDSILTQPNIKIEIVPQETNSRGLPFGFSV